MTAGALDLIAVHSVAAQHWRNGGGVTRELFAWPSAAHWLLRISLAEITRDARFSAFPGVERWFAVVQGDGVVLQLGGQRVALDCHSAPLHFDGAQAPWCGLRGGATRDLNVMTRRDAGSCGMQRLQTDVEWFSTAPLRALFTASPLTLQIDDADAAALPAWTLLVSRRGSRQRWRAAAAGDAPAAWWIDFTPILPE